MRKFIVKAFLLLTLNTLVTSCTLLESLALELVEQEWAVLNEDSISKGVIIIIINDEAIWEPADDARTLRDHIAQSLNLSIDDVKVPVYFFDTFTPPINIHDDQGEIIGSHYGSSYIYHFLSNPENGLHTVTLEFTSTSGRVFSRSWSIEID